MERRESFHSTSCGDGGKTVEDGLEKIVPQFIAHWPDTLKWQSGSALMTASSTCLVCLMYYLCRRSLESLV